MKPLTLLKAAPLALAFAANQSHAISEELIDPEDGMLDASQYLSQHMLGFLPVPVIITEPAVGTGLGVMGIFFHESEAQKQGKKATGIIPENITILGGAGTENGTRFVGAGHMGFWRGDSIRYKGGIGYPDVNLDFYRIANVDLANPLELNVSGPAILQKLSFRLGESHWFAGLYQTFQRMETKLAHRPDINLLPNDELNDKVEAYLEERLDIRENTSGLGLIMEYDSRDNPMNPEAGYNFSARAVRFDDAIGSDLNYTQYELTALNYWRLSDKVNLALRLDYESVEASSGETLPPYALPGLRMRGIPAARYQNNQIFVSEIEATYKLTPRWHLKGFGGAGFTGDSWSELTGDADNVESYGTGFRYLIAKRYGFTMGVDVAWGPEESAYYIQAGSSW